jgi:hypothetical protein
MRSTDLDQERDDWEALVTSAGWQRFLDHALSQYGSVASAREVLQRAANNDFDGAKATARAYELIGQLLAWPSDRLASLKRHERNQTGTPAAVARRAE